MFDPSSRYAGIETAKLTVREPDATERKVLYVRRRFLPAPESLSTLVEHRLTQGERLDLITARYMDDPTQFWRICDAHVVLRPEELEEVGRMLRIASPGVGKP